jgi:hypothetical protein
VNQNNPSLTDDQKKEVEMEVKFKILIAAGIADAMPVIITGTTGAFKKGIATKGEASKNSMSRKDKPKSKSTSREKKESETESGSESSDDSSYRDNSPSSDDTMDKPKGKKKKKKSKLGQSSTKPCTYKDFMACKPEGFKGDKTTIDALRWIEEMETTVDVSGCKTEDKIKFASQSFNDKAQIWRIQYWKRGEERTHLVWDGENSGKYF